MQAGQMQAVGGQMQAGGAQMQAGGGQMQAGGGQMQAGGGQMIDEERIVADARQWHAGETGAYGYQQGTPPPPGGPSGPGHGGFFPPVDPDRVGFHDDGGRLVRLSLRGALLTLLTLGFYRFWYMTDVRGFLWGHTRFDDDQLEYTGQGHELLIGFLIALAVIVPLNVLLFIATLDQGLLGFTGSLSVLLVFAVLGQFALYRARRYRLTRTVYRGIRFWQTGSGWIYALRVFLWSPLVILTLGLAYPFMTASLERYKVDHTWYGDLRGQFEGTGWGLWKRGLLLWLVVMLPLLIGTAVAVVSTDWPAALAALTGLSDMSAMSARQKLPDALEALIAAPAIGAMFSFWLGLLLLPVYTRIRYKWWAEGLHFDGLRFRSDIKARSLYGAYFLAYLLMAFFGGITSLIGLIIGAVIAPLLGFDAASFNPAHLQGPLMMTGYVLLGTYYLIIMLVYEVVYIAYLSRKLWKLKAASLVISGKERLHAVRQAGTEASGFGEGLADALDVGGF